MRHIVMYPCVDDYIEYRAHTWDRDYTRMQREMTECCGGDATLLDYCLFMSCHLLRFTARSAFSRITIMEYNMQQFIENTYFCTLWYSSSSSVGHQAISESPKSRIFIVLSASMSSTCGLSLVASMHDGLCVDSELGVCHSAYGR